MTTAPRLPLSSVQKQSRFFGLLAILGFIAYAWLLNPHGGPGLWSYDAFNSITGLPCPFCGGTRATHYLLRGEWHQMLYYNWLAVPSLIIGLALAGIMVLELVQQRVYLRMPRLSGFRVFFALLVILVIWVFHVYDAVQTPKPELLNSQGLYFKLKSENNPSNPH